MSSDSSSSLAGDTAQPRRRRSSDLVPRHRTLDGFVEAVALGDGIALIEVDAFATLVVRTDNSVCGITILTTHRREVLVQGGTFFPEHTRACLKRVGWRWQLSEARVDRYWAAPGIPRRGPVDHHVTRPRDRGRAVPNRAAVLADRGKRRTYAP